MNSKISDVVKELGLKPSRSLGQNFLYDLNLTSKITRVSSVTPGSSVLEIGPGPGALTRSILGHKPKNLLLIETDNRVIDYLSSLSNCYPDTDTRILNQDALKVSLHQLYARVGDKLHIIANLPYNIGTRLLINWLSEIDYISSMTLMFQKEVATRMVANPGSKDYSKLSVLLQALTTPKIAFTLPNKAFYPAPKVDSAVINLTPRADRINSEQFAALKYITAVMFSSRRKKIKHGLKKLFGSLSVPIYHGFDPDLRAEDLTVKQYVLLSQIYNSST